MQRNRVHMQKLDIYSEYIADMLFGQLLIYATGKFCDCVIILHRL